MKIARQWLCAHASVPQHSVTEVVPVRADWLAESGLMVVELFDAGHIRRLFVSGWVHGCRWATEANGQLQVMPGHADPGLPLFEHDVEWARPWHETIPTDVRNILSLFVHGRWALLYWASRYASALELLRSEPKLLWLLLMTGERAGWSESRMARCLRHKPRVLLKVCGLKSSRAALRVLEKCEWSSYGCESLGGLRSLLASAEAIHAIRHVGSIDSATLRFMQRFPALIIARWVQNATDDPGYFSDLNQLVGDIEEIGRQLHRDNVEDQMLGCRTVVELYRLHDRWVGQLNRRNNRGDPPSASVPSRPGNPAEWLRWPYRVLLNGIVQTVQTWSRWLSHYPSPPLPGTETIRPIRNYRALLEEGRSQHKWIVRHHPWILAGPYYVYQVLQPERCTLGLVLAPGQPPGIAYLRGVRNRFVGDETRHAVETWLKQGQQSPDTDRPQVQPAHNPERPGCFLDTGQRPPIQSLDLSAGGALGECDLAMVIVNPEQVDDVQQALHVVMQETFQESLRLALIPDPFAFEGPEKQHLAHLARTLIRPRVDALIRIDSHQLEEDLGSQWSPAAAKALLQETLTEVVSSITDSITQPTSIAVEFAQIRCILQGQGESFATVGIATGTGRAEHAARHAYARLAALCRFDTARGVLACIVAGQHMSAQDIDDVCDVLRETLSEDANIVVSIRHDLARGRMLVCMIAAGVES